MNLNNPFGDNYPFIGPPGNLPSEPKYVYDLYVSYYDPDLTYKLPLRIVSISKTSINLVDADGITIFNGTVSSRLWGSDYIVLQGTESSRNLFISAVVSKDIPELYEPTNGSVCIRCVYLQPKHITSIEVSGQKLRGNVVIDYGYNMDLTAGYPEDDSVRPNSTIVLNAVPGAGSGQTSSTCTDTLGGIKSIDGQEPNEYGDIYIYTDDCLKVSQKSKNNITVLDECIPCCECIDFSKAGKYLDRVIDSYYTIGGIVEAIRDSLIDLSELLSCGSTIMLRTNTFCPVRAYVDTTWKRHPGITAEFRNVLPAVVKNLKIKVDVACSPLIKHQALRTMYMDELACDGVYKDTQDSDNYKRIGIASSGYSTSGTLGDSWDKCNSWVIDWSDKPIAPGGTLWCTVSARNLGVDPKTGNVRNDILDSWKESLDEPITVTVSAQYDIEPVGCMQDRVDDIVKCFNGFSIINEHTATGVIKGGFGFDDYTEDDGDAGVVERIKELCKLKYGGKWFAR